MKAKQICQQIEAILPGSTTRTTPFDALAIAGQSLTALPACAALVATSSVSSAYRTDSLGSIDSDLQGLQAWVQRSCRQRCHTQELRARRVAVCC